LNSSILVPKKQNTKVTMENQKKKNEKKKKQTRNTKEHVVGASHER
jgi:hypothetical protein